MLKKLISPAFFFVACLSFTGICRADAPDWLRSLANQPVKAYADDVNFVVLLEDENTTVADNGDIVKRGRRAVRILRPQGREAAGIFAVQYNRDSKVNYLLGWSITGKGQEYATRAGDVFEQSISSYEVYSDAKVKALRVPGADVGTVVGYEYEIQQHPYVFQDYWIFQEVEPVERARYELHLPQGWRVKSDWMNQPEEKADEEKGAPVADCRRPRHRI